MADSTADVRAAAAAAGERSADTAHPVAVKGAATMSVTVVLLALLVASVAVFLMSSSPHHAGDGKRVEQGAADGRRGEPVEHAVRGDVVGIPGFNTRLDAFRTWARLTWMKLRRPRSDEPGYHKPESASSVVGAAKKSFDMGKETVEQAAATAGKVTGEAVEKAKRAAVAADDDEL